MFPTEIARLFWELDPATLDLGRDRDYVMERLMTRGGLDAMRWLVATYPPSQLGDFVIRRGQRLAPRERAFWALMAGIRIEAGPGGGRPAWAG